MRTYNRKFINKEMKNVAEQSIELQNGIIWTVDTTEHNCGVKLLGSTDIINIDFPPSWQVVPAWIQQGAPVQMSHRYGFKNTLEILGPGHIIPAQTTGNNSPTLDNSLLPDRVLSGCVVQEIYLSPAMSVNIKSGIVRIGGDTVSVTGVTATVTPSPTAVNVIRYDMFAVGTDAVIDLITGTTFKTSATVATFPTLPAAHIEIDSILVHYGASAIVDNDIGRAYTKAAPQTIHISADDIDLASAQTTAAITAEVRDQYQNALLPPNTTVGWDMELEVLGSAGSVSSTAGTSTAIIGAVTGSSAGYTFTFIKAGSTVDIPAMFTARLTTISIENSFGIIVRAS